MKLRLMLSLANIVVVVICSLCLTVTSATAAGRGPRTPTKRQGLFLCSGWGASCTSGWRFRTAQAERPFRQRARPSAQANQQRTLRQYWLTTEKSWGPPIGKRTTPADHTIALFKAMAARHRSKTGPSRRR